MKIVAYRGFGIYEISKNQYRLNNGTNEGITFNSWQKATECIDKHWEKK